MANTIKPMLVFKRCALIAIAYAITPMFLNDLSSLVVVQNIYVELCNNKKVNVMPRLAVPDACLGSYSSFAVETAAL